MRIVQFCRFLNTYSVRVSELTDSDVLNKHPDFEYVCSIYGSLGNFISAEYAYKKEDIKNIETFKELIWKILHRKKPGRKPLANSV